MISWFTSLFDYSYMSDGQNYFFAAMDTSKTGSSSIGCEYVRCLITSRSTCCWPSTTHLTIVNRYPTLINQRIPIWSTTELMRLHLSIKSSMKNIPCVDWRVTRPNVLRKDQKHRFYINYIANSNWQSGTSPLLNGEIKSFINRNVP